MDVSSRGQKVKDRQEEEKTVKKDNGKENGWDIERTIEICIEKYKWEKKQSCALAARNKVKLLMLEGGCVECSRWKKQDEMWKITYYAQFRKWLDPCTVVSLSHTLHLFKKCHSNKILFSPHEFTHFGTQQITVLLHIFHSTHSRARLLLIHNLCALICLHIGQNTYFILRWWVDGGISAIKRDQRVCWFIHLCQCRLCVIADMPLWQVCSPWTCLWAYKNTLRDIKDQSINRNFSSSSSLFKYVCTCTCVCTCISFIMVTELNNNLYLRSPFQNPLIKMIENINKISSGQRSY